MEPVTDAARAHHTIGQIYGQEPRHVVSVGAYTMAAILIEKGYVCGVFRCRNGR
jgi:hypothetical protein